MNKYTNMALIIGIASLLTSCSKNTEEAYEEVNKKTISIMKISDIQPSCMKALKKSMENYYN